MNRRLFVGQVVAGASLLSIPSSLVARPVFLRSDALSTTDALKNATEWAKNGSLGSLQHITLSHVYSPEHTSLSKLMAIVQEDLAKVNELLGTNFTITSQAMLGLASSKYGSHSVQLEQNDVKITWQGLARIGDKTKKPATQLRLFGSKGAVQAAPDGSGYQFIDWQGRVSQTENRFNKLAKHFNRRTLFTNWG